MSVKRLATLAVAIVMLGLLIPATALAAPGGSGGASTPNNSCPSSTANFLTAPNVGADSTGATTRTYTFTSFVNENSVKGVPGLVGYCVYTNTQASTVGTAVSNWTATLLKGKKSFVFARSGGNATNIPLDGTTKTIGTATFTTAPTSQTILLHINDAAVCQSSALYGAGSPDTCWVLPGTKPGAVCDTGSGDTLAAYNSMPKDVEHCGPPSRAFQAQQTSEFGDLVGLDTTGGTQLKSLSVDFQSYACQTGGWNTGDCVTTPGATWTIPDTSGFPGSGGITANIYAVGADDPNGNPTVGALLATSHVNPSAIPFRPSAVNDSFCPNPPADPNAAPNSRYVDLVSGRCAYSIYTLVTFTNWTFPSGAPTFSDGDHVIWTVAFNTQSYGYQPIGLDGPWNSLNVGTKTFLNAPYAGTDVEPSGAFVYASNPGSGYCDNGTGGIDVLRDDIDNPDPCDSAQYDPTAWVGLTPLASIVLQ